MSPATKIHVKKSEYSVCTGIRCSLYEEKVYLLSASISCTTVVVCLGSICLFQPSLVKTVTMDPEEGNLCFCADLGKNATQYILLLLSYFLFTLHTAHEPVLSCFINGVPAQSFFSFHLTFTLMIISTPMTALHRNHRYYC